MISTQQITRGFGTGDQRRLAVNGVDLQAKDGTITGLLGPNGAGKTTLLRLLCGLLDADSGQASIDGHDPARDPGAARARLGVLVEAQGLYERLTARENVAYFGQLHGLGGYGLGGYGLGGGQAQRDLDAAVDTALEQVGASDLAHRRCVGFSRGERLKVALARALVHRPANLILDEPTEGLDVLSTRNLRRLLGQLRDEGRCVLVSSHVMQEVGALCDRVIVLAQGKVIADGTPDELRRSTGRQQLEDAFVELIGTEEGLQ